MKSTTSDSSTVFRKQITNLAARMRYLTTQTILYPLRNMTAFNKASNNFDTLKNEAKLCCSVMDTAQSIESEQRAANSTVSMMKEMVDLKDKATDLINDEPEDLQNPRPPL